MKVLEIEKNEYLKKKVEAYYHGYHRGWNDTEVGFINTLKNDNGTFSDQKKEFGYTLSSAQKRLYESLELDLPIIAESLLGKITICVVPRSKCNYNYKPTQLLFISTIKKFVLNNLDKFYDGTAYITRHIDTPTTHNSKNDKSIDVGITERTCDISNNVKDKDILLIDDIYTKSINIDEDAIQALLSNGARSVVFYAVGHTEYNRR